jgi:aminoglycoside/choline kinase family phosphotransferase
MERYIVAAAKFLGLPEEQWQPDTVRMQVISSDGSQRRFIRLVGPGDRHLLVIKPPEGDEAGLREAKSACSIGQHLYARGIPVPEIYGFDPKNGQLFVEDLGDERLYDVLRQASEEKRLFWYKQVIAELVRMQIQGADEFSLSWCWDTPCYDRQLMIKRESGYFLQALCRDYCNLSFDRQRIEGECRLLADRAGRAPADFFLHRDFQSRNIMIKDGRVRIIDFQGGRLGPLAYDLASLLIDPYMALSSSLRQKVKEIYFSELRKYIPYDYLQFKREYALLALQRNLQILGAFAFLDRQRGKIFFSRFIQPALLSLNSLLAKPETADYGGLRKLARQCLSSLTL